MKSISTVLIIFLFSFFIAENAFSADSSGDEKGLAGLFKQVTNEDEEQLEEGEAQVVTAVQTAAPVYKPTPKVYQPIRKPYTVVNPVPASAGVARNTKPVQTVDAVQSEVNELVELNKTINLTRQTQSLELQRTLEQARIHQKILDNLKKEEEKEGNAADSLDSQLRQEKLKAISAETQKNKSSLTDTSKQKTNSSDSSNQPKKQGWFFG